MSLYYAERRALAETLRRHVHQAVTGIVASYDTTNKMYILALIDKFEKWGLSSITDVKEQQMLTTLLSEALA